MQMLSLDTLFTKHSSESEEMCRDHQEASWEVPQEGRTHYPISRQDLMYIALGSQDTLLTTL